jgi:hypothetical protein
MRSSKFHEALRRPAFDIADSRGNNPHQTQEAAENEGRRLNGYRYETVGQVEAALDPRQRVLAARAAQARLRALSGTPPAPQGQSSDNTALVLLGLAAVGAILWAASSDEDGEMDDDEMDAEPLRENPPAALPSSAAPHNVTVNLTLPAGLTSNPASPAQTEPVHVTVPVMAPIVVPPPEPAPAPLAAAAVLNPEKKRRRRKGAV